MEFVYDDGSEQLVEVKGSKGSGPFDLTLNERRAAATKENWILYFLADQVTEEPKLYRFTELGARLKDEHLRATSWWVVGWPALDPETIPVLTSSRDSSDARSFT